MTPTTEERMKILQMLEDGKLTADEAAALLRAVEGGQRAAPRTAGGLDADGRYLHVHVTDIASGVEKVNVTIPVRLVKVGLRMAERFAPDFENVDMDELGEIIASGVTGKLVEVQDMEDGERVEVYVD